MRKMFDRPDDEIQDLSRPLGDVDAVAVRVERIRLIVAEDGKNLFDNLIYVLNTHSNSQL